MNNYRTGSFTVTKFLAVESGSYGQQYRRPHETKLTGDVEQIIVDRYRRHNGNADTGMVVAGVSGRFVTPQAQPEAPIEIRDQYGDVAGWDRVRYRVLVEVEMQHHTGAKLRATVMAFSDFMDPSLTGYIDPDMRYRINNIIGLRMITEVRATGKIPIVGVANTSHLISNEGYAGYSSPKRENLTRPMDVFSYISRSVIDGDASPDDMYDTRTIASKIPVKSERKNTVGSNYVAKVLGAYVQSYNTAGALGGTGFDTMLEAQSVVNENEAAEDWFLSALKNLRQAPAVNNYFTLQELCDLSPHSLQPTPGGAHNVLHVVRLSQAERANIYHHGQTYTDGAEVGDWGKAIEETRIASILSNSIPSLMVEQMFTRAHIKASNRVHADGRIDVHVADYDSFSEIDMGQNLQVLEARIALEVMSEVTNNNQFDVDIEMLVQIDGESRFMVSWNGRPTVEYVAPSFADSLFAPVITSYEDRAYKMARDFRALGDLITDAKSQATTMSSRNPTSYQGGFTTTGGNIGAKPF
jgi:hypothetical protein